MLKQLVDSASAESANYRASRRSRTRKEFVAKIGLVAEEADESEHWLEVLNAGGLVKGTPALNELAYLYGESVELRAICVASARTARANYARLCEAKRSREARRRGAAKPSGGSKSRGEAMIKAEPRRS